MKADVEPDQPHRSKGLLKGISPDQVASSGVNIYDPNLTVEQLWGEDAALSGGALLDHVLAYYSDGQKDIPFFYTPSEIPQARAVVKSPLSRELQESTVESYKKRIFLESISQVAAGEPVFKFRTTERKFPIESGTWNHRLEACYRAMSEQPHNLNVSSVMDRGLRSVKLVHPDIPWQIWERFINAHNTFHRGSAANFLEYMQETIKIEASWEHECLRTGLHSHNPRYKSYYRDFVMKTSMFFSEWDPFRKALSLTHILIKFKIWEELKKFFNSTVDFLNSDLDPNAVIACMHQLTLLITGNLQKYWKQEHTGILLSHALRHCVQPLVYLMRKNTQNTLNSIHYAGS
ncbi:unnamed protein product [Durusdinium trenchii]|uniref:Uncharacterized protein n=1 Tax=Durusdinium trenchii TaxID=1381693 RepID=A0ABP0IN09_9DINO